MSREEAIKWLNDYIQNTPFQMEQYEKAFVMAIQALSQEPTSPCDVCRFNPPSSTDGKPCCMCPATPYQKGGKE